MWLCTPMGFMVQSVSQENKNAQKGHTVICTLLQIHLTHGYCSELRLFSIAAKELSLKCQIKFSINGKTLL